MPTLHVSKRRPLRRSVHERGRKVIKAVATKSMASDRRAMSADRGAAVKYGIDDYVEIKHLRVGGI